MEQPNYYAIIPADVRYDCNLTDKEKLLYGEITALSNVEGYCWASNSYFSELYKIAPETVSRSITKLINNGYLKRTIIYKKETKEIEKRLLYPLTKMSPGIDNFINTPIDENVKDNNTSINNTSINNKEKEIYKEKESFRKPTIDEIKDYCEERNNHVDAEKFYYYYESKGWLVGKTKMKNWKAAVITWEKNPNVSAPKKKRSSFFC